MSASLYGNVSTFGQGDRSVGSQQLVAKYRRDGYVVVEDLLSDDTIARLRAKTDAWIAQSREVAET